MVLSKKVNVRQGAVIGGEDVLPNGNRYYFFKGIPFAVPPLGKLRFKAPVPLKKFSVPELECIKEGPMSLQQDRVTDKITIGSEDCLYLNIYIPKSESKTPLPVMLFIHGGRFLTGSGNTDKHNPLYLLQEGVVVVTFNYRLGILGFLSFPEAGIPGNAGLKDQVLAMKWVKENISQFNGDSNNITLLGHSSGAESVHIHLYSANSKKLFHKVLMQSIGYSQPRIKDDTKLMGNGLGTRNLAKFLGCTSNNPLSILEFLQNFNDLEEFVKPTVGLQINEKPNALPIIPVVEEESPEAVLTRNIFEAMREINSVEVPVLMGYTNAEALPLCSTLGKKLKDLHWDFSKFITDQIIQPLNNQKRIDMNNSIKEFYFKGQQIDESSTYQLCDLLSDYYFISNIREAAEMHTRFQPKSPLYFYRFDFDGQLNLYKTKNNITHLKGAAHADELCYVFQMEFAPPQPWEGEAHRMVLSLCKMWTNFAKYSNPTPTIDKRLSGCIWEPVEKCDDWENLNIKAVILDKEIKMMENPDGERMAFWRNLKNYHK